MKNSLGLKKAVVASAAVLALSVLTAAPAMASVAILGQSSQGGLTNDAGIGFAQGYGANTPANASWDIDPTVFVPPGNQGSVYQSPFNNNSLTDTTNYFSVGAHSAEHDSGVVGAATLTYKAVQTVFNILWGSIDTYNTLTFLDQAGVAILGETYTGSDIISQLAAFSGGNSTNSEQVALVHFVVDGGFWGVKFESSQAAFESAHAPIPLPPAILLFGSGIAGLGMLARRRKNKLSMTSAVSA